MSIAYSHTDTSDRGEVMRGFASVLLSVALGASFGMLAALAGIAPHVLGDPLTAASSKVSSVIGDLETAGIFGAFVGLFCSPFTAAFLHRRDLRYGSWMLLAGCSPLVLILALVLNSVFVLMLLSGMAYCGLIFVLGHTVTPVRSGDLQCNECGYDLRGSLGSQRCPECGKDFHPLQVSTPTNSERESIRTQAHAHREILWAGVLLPWGIAFALAIAGYGRGLPEPFNSARWLAGQGDARLVMARSLIGSGRLDGVSEAEVLSLLGPPDKRNQSLAYLVSADEAIEIRLDSTGAVSHVRKSRSFSGQGIVPKDKAGTHPGENRLTSIEHVLAEDGTEGLMTRTEVELRTMLGPPDEDRVFLSYVLSSRQGARTLATQAHWGMRRSPPIFVHLVNDAVVSADVFSYNRD